MSHSIVVVVKSESLNIFFYYLKEQGIFIKCYYLAFIRSVRNKGTLTNPEALSLISAHLLRKYGISAYNYPGQLFMTYKEMKTD